MVIELAREEDREEILELYHMQIGREFCPWDEHYPSNEEITYDLSRDALYVLREEPETDGREADEKEADGREADVIETAEREADGTEADARETDGRNADVRETDVREADRKEADPGSRKGRIIAAVSLEEDPQVDGLPCWTEELQPGGEIARVAVHPEYQNRGIARQMVQFALDRLRERGYKSFHGIVNALNEKALRSYAVFGFRKMGECDMYDQHFICYELKL